MTTSCNIHSSNGFIGFGLIYNNGQSIQGVLSLFETINNGNNLMMYQQPSNQNVFVSGTMTKLILFIIAVIIFNGTNYGYAQQATTASGGKVSGSGGNISYTVGQIGYTTHTSNAGSVAQGVQQAYSISVVSGVSESDIQLNVSVYPNPATEFLTLQVALNSRPMIYQLFDISGKLLESNTVVTDVTTIKMEQLANATYFLKVIQNNKEIKTFKIIKN